MRTPEEELERIPVSKQGIYAKAVGLNGEKKSKTFAIKAMCYSCIGWEDISNSIRNCGVSECPLYPHRPFQK